MHIQFAMVLSHDAHMGRSRRRNDSDGIWQGLQGPNDAASRWGSTRVHESHGCCCPYHSPSASHGSPNPFSGRSKTGGGGEPLPAQGLEGHPRLLEGWRLPALLGQPISCFTRPFKAQTFAPPPRPHTHAAPQNVLSSFGGTEGSKSKNPLGLGGQVGQPVKGSPECPKGRPPPLSTPCPAPPARCLPHPTSAPRTAAPRPCGTPRRSPAASAPPPSATRCPCRRRRPAHSPAAGTAPG